MKIIVLFFCLIFIGISNAKLGFGPGEQEWDFVQVRPGAHMFWWLFYTTADVTKPSDQPLIIWLQGGPGASSTGFGNFLELGPLDIRLRPRNFTWVKDYNILFIDIPVGTGFSNVNSSSALATNNTQISLDLMECLKGFHQKLPEFENTSLYLAGESYGGKIAVEFAQLVNNVGGQALHLKAIILLDSWISPIDSVLAWAPYLLQTGIVDEDGFEQIQESAERCKRRVDANKWDSATSIWEETEKIMLKATFNVDAYNILSEISTNFRISQPQLGRGLKRKSNTESNEMVLKVLMRNKVKKALNIPADFNWHLVNGKVFDKLVEDFMKPVTSKIEELLNKTDIKIYIVSGQLDLIVNTPGTYNWVMRLNFPDKSKWDASPRYPLPSKGVIEGFVKKYKQLSFYWVHRSGHMVPADNPKAMSEILRAVYYEN